MGVAGLFQFLRRHEQNVYIPTFVRNKIVAIDIFTYVHKSKGRQKYFIELLTPFIVNAKKIIAVFDGSPSEQRSENLLDNKIHKDKIKEEVEEIRRFIHSKKEILSRMDKLCLEDYVIELENRAWMPSPDYVWQMHDVLKSHGVECVICDKGVEADTYLIEIQRSVDLIVSGDSDLLVNGVSRLLRPNGLYYEKEALLSCLEFKDEEWEMFLRICKALKKSDPEFAFSVTKLYGDEEFIYDKYDKLFRFKTEDEVESS